MRLRLLKKFVKNVYGYDAVSVRVVQAFSIWKFWCQYASRSDRLITGKVDEIMEKVEQDRRISNHDIGKELNIDYKSVLNHLEKTGYKKLNIWVPHDLTMKNLMDRISICESLLK